LNPRFSPDGREIAFWTGSDAQFGIEPGRIFVVPAAGGPPRQLVSDFKDARLPAWSPKGDELLFQGCGPRCDDPERNTDWWRVGRDGNGARSTGALQDVLNQGLTLYLSPPVWGRDNTIVFGARMEHGTNLWRIPISKPFWPLRRKAVFLMTSTEDDVEPSIAPNGEIAFTGLQVKVNVWKARIQQGAVDAAHPLNRNVEIDSMPSISSHGDRLLYFRRIGNSRKMIIEDERRVEILAKDVPTGTRGVISASGNLVAYSSPSRQSRQVGIMRAPSWTPLMISEDGGEPVDIFDQDRRLLVTTKAGISSLDIISGQSVPLLQNNGFYIDQAAVSPDGNWILFLYIKDSNHSQIYVAPMRSSLIAAQEWINISPESSWYDSPRWTRDGRGVVFLSNRDDFVCIWKQDLEASMRVHGTPIEVVQIHRANDSPMHLIRIAFNLSVAEDAIIFNAAHLASNIAIAREQ